MNKDEICESNSFGNPPSTNFRNNHSEHPPSTNFRNNGSEHKKWSESQMENIRNTARQNGSVNNQWSEAQREDIRNRARQFMQDRSLEEQLLRDDTETEKVLED